MRDHYFLTENGQRLAVAELPDATIADLLTDGSVEIVSRDHPGDIETAEGVIERLRIEVLIRQLRL